MTDSLAPVLADLEVELALRGFTRRADGDDDHVWRRAAPPAMRVRVRRDARRPDRVRGDLRCDGIGVLRFGRRSGKEQLGVEAVLSTIDAWLARARRAASGSAGAGSGLADEDRWISAVELTPPSAAASARGQNLAVAQPAVLPAVVDDLTGELRLTLQENRSLHRELADVRERAARAETESAFLSQRLQEVMETAAALGELRRRLEDTRADEAQARARADVAESELARLRRELDEARSIAPTPTAAGIAPAAGSQSGGSPSTRPETQPGTRRGPQQASRPSDRPTTLDALRRYFGSGRRSR